MGIEEYRKAIDTYRKRLNDVKIKKRFPTDLLFPMRDQALAHCSAMLDEMEEFLRDGRIGKLNRWLGFIQGVLWAHGLFSLEELKNHNRP